ncbi:hypothetical protein BC834DRAFT_120591 [Gloeopeniophorella convolvens]|nr:hypothetical protein BC834DRAFT_120591 [Gloeopeniophorella convolvens]
MGRVTRPIAGGMRREGGGGGGGGGGGERPHYGGDRDGDFGQTGVPISRIRNEVVIPDTQALITSFPSNIVSQLPHWYSIVDGTFHSATNLTPLPSLYGPPISREIQPSSLTPLQHQYIRSRLNFSYQFSGSTDKQRLVTGACHTAGLHSYMSVDAGESVSSSSHPALAWSFVVQRGPCAQQACSAIYHHFPLLSNRYPMPIPTSPKTRWRATWLLCLAPTLTPACVALTSAGRRRHCQILPGRWTDPLCPCVTLAFVSSIHHPASMD